MRPDQPESVTSEDLAKQVADLEKSNQELRRELHRIKIEIDDYLEYLNSEFYITINHRSLN